MAHLCAKLPFYEDSSNFAGYESAIALTRLSCTPLEGFFMADQPVGVLRLYYPGGSVLPSHEWERRRQSTAAETSRWTQITPQLRHFLGAKYTSTTLRELMGTCGIIIPEDINILDFFNTYTKHRATLVRTMLEQEMIPEKVDLTAVLRELDANTTADRSMLIISTLPNDTFNFNFPKNVALIPAHGLSVPQMQEKRYEHEKVFSSPDALVIYIGYATSSDMLSLADAKNRFDVAVPLQIQAKTSLQGPNSRIVRSTELDHMLDSAISVVCGGDPISTWHAPTWMCVQAGDEEAAKRYRGSGCDSHSYPAVSGTETRWLALLFPPPSIAHSRAAVTKSRLLFRELARQYITLSFTLESKNYAAQPTVSHSEVMHRVLRLFDAKRVLSDIISIALYADGPDLWVVFKAPEPVFAKLEKLYQDGQLLNTGLPLTAVRASTEHDFSSKTLAKYVIIHPEVYACAKCKQKCVRGVSHSCTGATVAPPPANIPGQTISYDASIPTGSINSSFPVGKMPPPPQSMLVPSGPPGGIEVVPSRTAPKQIQTPKPPAQSPAPVATSPNSAASPRSLPTPIPPLRIVLQPFETKSSVVVTFPSSAKVAELIAQGVASFKWTKGHAWFGEDMQPTKTLADYKLANMDTVLFAKELATHWSTHPQYEAVRVAAAARKGTG